MDGMLCVPDDSSSDDVEVVRQVFRMFCAWYADVFMEPVPQLLSLDEALEAVAKGRREHRDCG